MAEHADFEDVLNKLGVEYRDKGTRLEMLCPFHDDTNPSAAVYLDTQRFWCFSCSLSYNVAQFYAHYTGNAEEKAERIIEEEFGELPKYVLDKRKAEAEKNWKRMFLRRTFTGDRTKDAERAETAEQIAYLYIKGRIDDKEYQTFVDEWLGTKLA